MRFCKFCSILGRDHAAAIIDSPLYQRITRIKIVLSFHVYNQTNQFPGYRSQCQKPDIIGNCSFRQRSVFISRSMYHGSLTGFIRSNGCFSYLRYPLNIFFCNLIHITIPIFLQTVFHNPCQYNLFRKQPLTGRIITGFLICHTNILRYGRICIHNLTSLSCLYFIILHKNRLLHF